MNVAVGMSGGVDSAVAALLLRNAGHHVTGVTMRLWRPGKYKGGADGSCFGPGEEQNIASASAIAQSLSIPYRVFDLSSDYEREVIAYFRSTSLAGKTPNPCVRCNELVKFGILPAAAKRAGLAFDFFATGHYARIDRSGPRLALLRAADLSKDQSYFLYRLSQTTLASTLFPLGDLKKSEVRQIALDHSLVVAGRPDSQDFCTGGTDDLIGSPDRPGDIVDSSGRRLGSHRGYWHYTIGQRKGLGIGGAGAPYYVIELNACRNQVIVGRADEAVRTSFTVADMNWVSIPPSQSPIPCRVKIRSASNPVPATLAGNSCSVPQGVSGVAPGQSAVFYSASSDAVLAGGVIQ